MAKVEPVVGKILNEALEAAAGNAMLSGKATDALRMLFARTKLL